MIFQRELASPAFYEELKPLIALHYDEISAFKDIALEPDWDRYTQAELGGMLRVFTARDEQTNALLGYAIFIINYNMHYKSSLQALQDILFIRPDKRGKGARFIAWCDNELKKEGVQLVYHHVKKAHNFGALLERMGYHCVDLIYAKRLDLKGE